MRLERPKADHGEPCMLILGAMGSHQRMEAGEGHDLIFIYKMNSGCEKNGQKESTVGEEWAKVLTKSYSLF